MENSRRNLRVTDIFNVVSGAYVDAEIYLSQDERRIGRLRRWLTEFHQVDKKYLVCSMCGGAVYLKGGSGRDPDQQLHFAHYQSSEYESCSLNDKNKHLTVDEIRAIKYNGVPESKRHCLLKNKLGSIMGQDNDCDQVHVDELYKGRLKHERRRPDVQCTYKGLKIVFEIQLSTEFVTVISERERYYKEKGAFLLWIFDSISTSNLMNRSEKDIFYLNNSNAFCLDKGSLEKSEKQKKLNLLVLYEYPEIEGGQIVSRAATPKRITIDDISFNQDSYSPFFFDYDSRFQELKRSLICQNIEKMIQENRSEELAGYVFRISDMKFNYEQGLFSFLLYMFSGKMNADIAAGDSSKYVSYCQSMFNPSGNSTMFAYFYTMTRHHGHDLPEGNGRMPINHKLKMAFKDLRVNKEKSSYYPKPEWQELFAFLFPDEYQRFLTLIKWYELPWESANIEKFKRLQLY